MPNFTPLSPRRGGVLKTGLTFRVRGKPNWQDKHNHNVNTKTMKNGMDTNNMRDTNTYCTQNSKDIITSGYTISDELIENCLYLFKKDWQFVEESKINTLHPPEIGFTFKSYSDPFKFKTHHLTRNHIIMYVAQSAYITGGVMSEHNVWSIGPSKFFNIVQQEQATFKSIELNFDEFISNDKFISVESTCQDWKKYKERMVCKFKFNVEDKCTIHSTGVISLDGSFGS